jgi:hypothetical protein
MTDTRIELSTAQMKMQGQLVTVKTVAHWWVWHPGYLTVFLLATVGSLVFGFVPGWGGPLAAVCTIIACVTGFKAGVRYIRETIA